jgi:hypothetical protein
VKPFLRNSFYVVILNVVFLRRHPERSEGSPYLSLQLPLLVPLFVIHRVLRLPLTLPLQLLLLLQLQLFVLRRHPERSEGPLYLPSLVLCRYCLSGSWIDAFHRFHSFWWVLRARRKAQPLCPKDGPKPDGRSVCNIAVASSLSTAKFVSSPQRTKTRANPAQNACPMSYAPTAILE